MTRAPGPVDIDAWMHEVFNQTKAIDPQNQYDWGDLARGWLIGRGVDPAAISYGLLCGMVHGDYVKMVEGL